MSCEIKLSFLVSQNRKRFSTEDSRSLTEFVNLVVLFLGFILILRVKRLCSKINCLRSIRPILEVKIFHKKSVILINESKVFFLIKSFTILK